MGDYGTTKERTWPSLGGGGFREGCLAEATSKLKTWKTELCKEEKKNESEQHMQRSRVKREPGTFREFTHSSRCLGLEGGEMV